MRAIAAIVATVAVLGTLLTPIGRIACALDQAHVLADGTDQAADGTVDVAVAARSQTCEAPPAALLPRPCARPLVARGAAATVSLPLRL